MLLLLACADPVATDSAREDKDGIELIPGDPDATGGTGQVDTDPDSGDSGDSGDTDTGDTGETADTDDSYTPTPYDTSAFDCGTEIPALPVSFSDSLPISGGEDFTFLTDGRVAAIQGDRLMFYDGHGGSEFVMPGVSNGGISQLPTGEIIIADRSANAIKKIGLDGSVETLAATPGWPNGVRVGPDGMIYYDEGSGAAWKVDPDSREVTLVTDDLYAPNGIVVDNDGVVYIGDDYGWIEVVRPKGDGSYHAASLYADLPDWTSLEHDCERKEEGDACTNPVGYGMKVGNCRDDGAGGLGCDTGLDRVACAGLAEGDACSTEYFGTMIETTCRSTTEGEIFCPRALPDHEAACGDVGDACEVDGVDGRCERTDEGIVVCGLPEAQQEAMVTACEGLAEGDLCDVATSTQAYGGTCRDPGAGLRCQQSWVPGANPVDAIDLDECGQIYASSFYGYGNWRWTGPGTEPIELTEPFPSSSLTAMRFGRLGAGFDNRTLYLYERGKGLHAIEIGVPGNQSR